MDLLSDLSVAVYEPPLSLLRDTGAISDLSRPICVLMLIIDFDTEVAMNGLLGFLGNSTGLYATEIVSALQIIGCSSDAGQLERILETAGRAGMSSEAIQSDRAGSHEYRVTTAKELHGDKWESVTRELEELAIEVQFDRIMEQAEAYAGAHFEDLAAVLRAEKDVS